MFYIHVRSLFPPSLPDIAMSAENLLCETKTCFECVGEGGVIISLHFIIKTLTFNYIEWSNKGLKLKNCLCIHSWIFYSIYLCAIGEMGIILFSHLKYSIETVVDLSPNSSHSQVVQFQMGSFK